MTDKIMKTSKSSHWSELPIDILRSLFERLSFMDFHRAKIVCSNWYSCSKQSLVRENRSLWLILFPEDGGCALYNPDEARIYRTKRDFSGTRFLANSGSWFLMVDSRSNLYIMDVFTEKKIDLPPLESINGVLFRLERVGDKEFSARIFYEDREGGIIQNAESLRGLLWVDEKKEEYVVVWFFDKGAKYLAFCKNGEDHHRKVSTRIDRKDLRGISDMVLHGGNSLYVSTTASQYIQKVNLSRNDGFWNVCTYDHVTNRARFNTNIVVTTSGEVLFVQSIFSETTEDRIFRVYKKGPDPDPDNIFVITNLPTVEVYSLGDEALLLDLGITVPADRNRGIEPNSIYFTRHDRACYHGKPSCPDICVYNLATKAFKRFPGLGLSNNLKLKDARWFLPS